MLRAWVDELVVTLGAHRVELARRSLTGKLGPVDAASVDTAVPSWEASLGALERQWQGAAWSVRRLQVRIGAQFVRFVVLGAASGNEDSEERMAIARFRLGEVFGVKADSWSVAVSREGSLAAAVDRDLIEGLQGIAAGRGARLRSVEPSLSAAVTRFRGRLRGSQGFIALVEPGRLCLAQYAGERWVAVENRRLAEGSSAELGLLLEQCLIGKLSSPIYLYAPGHLDLDYKGGHDLVRLELPGAPREAPFAAL